MDRRHHLRSLDRLPMSHAARRKDLHATPPPPRLRRRRACCRRSPPAPTMAGAASTRTGRSISRARRARSSGSNPHAEFDARLTARPALPADLAQAHACRRNRRGRRRAQAARGGPAADAQGPGLGDRARAADAHGSVEGRRDQAPASRSRCSASPSPARRARRCCAPSTCSSAARPTACALRRR